jgi:hypothetical protein
MLTRFVLYFKIKYLIHTNQYNTVRGVFSKCTL